MKKVLTVLTAVLLIFLFVSTANAEAASFSDISSSRHRAAIEKAAELGIVNGYEDGTFRPDGSVTRAEFCAMVNRALGITAFSPVGFTDVSTSDWFFGDVQSAVTVGYIVGMSPERFAPAESITRYQCALILSRLAGYTDSGAKLRFSDKSSIPDWAYTGAAYASESGVFDDICSSAFQGNKSMTRAETASVLTSYLKQLKKLPLFFTLMTADASNHPLNTSVLYRNEYTKIVFAVSGRDLAADYSGLSSGTIMTDSASKIEAARDKLAADLQFSFSGGVGVHTLDYTGRVSSSPVYYTVESADSNTFLFTVLLDRADYLPAWFNTHISLPVKGNLYSKYSIAEHSQTVRFTEISEYSAAAANPMLLYRAVESQGNYEQHRYLSWISNPKASDYSISFVICRADGVHLPNTETAYSGSFNTYGSRIEADITDYVSADPADIGGKGAYHLIIVSANGKSGSDKIVSTELPIRANSYVQLVLNGKSADTMAKIGKSGLNLKLNAVNLSELLSAPNNPYNCELKLSVLDASYSDVSAAFTLTDSHFAFSEYTNVTTPLKSSYGMLALGNLQASSARPGCYTLLCQCDVVDLNTKNVQTVCLSSAIIVQ